MPKRVLLSTIGSRGDVQPLVALGLALRARGHDVRMCVPPDFRAWIEELGLAVTPIGPELRSTAKANPAARPSPEQLQQLIEGTVATQFDTIGHAARDRDAIIGATALQVAAPSIAAKLGIPYHFAAYCPGVLPSRRHAPPVLAQRGDLPAPAADDYNALWVQDRQRWNTVWRALINKHRTALGLAPIDDVLPHILTDRPWLAADPTLGPWPDDGVVQTGAWLLPDARPLPPELRAFLDAGEPPIYFGFGSIAAPTDLARAMIESARALGRRAILSRGWADLALVDDGRDCIAIGDTNHQTLFPRVAAVVHHGGAGTTTATARAGVPHVVIPQHYDQHYWAGRVRELSIGVAHELAAPTSDSLARALERALRCTATARVLAPAIRADGADIAASQLA